MMQTADDVAGRILDEISRIWDEGIVLSDSVLDYLGSALGITDADALRRFLGRADDPERETVLELIFFPEPLLRLGIEAVLTVDGMSAAREVQIAAALLRRHPRVRLRLPRDSDPLWGGLSPDQADAFVSRLYLTRSLSLDICRTLESCHARSEALAARVVMRCNQRTMVDDTIRFAVRFVRKASGRQGFGDLFETFWDLICDAPDSIDPAAYFLERQYRERILHQRIEKFQRDLSRWGMEYLMMSRYQIPTESLEIVSERRALIDTIITEILGLGPLNMD